MLSPEEIQEEIKRVSERTLKEAKYIISNKSTLRKTGEAFGVSRTTVLNDINRLKNTDYDLYLEVQKIIKNNKETSRSRAITAWKERSKKNANKHE